jgi:hypothetical protein
MRRGFSSLVILKPLNEIGCFSVSRLYGFACSLALFSSSSSCFMNLSFAVIRESSICNPIIAMLSV